ncbi:hypothetical protein [Listeria booriae]|uniref:hypothetical protein n=1 Tax=Listeria booriae TaxID=1552123 RepID=UPI001624E6FC|nr:hypothetical protein [Listeria booriae]MBC2188708.1 hypothetical protein [Listeria booriae]
MEMYEIEGWIREQDKQNAHSDILYYLEFDNGESYSDHYTSVDDYYFKTVKEAFDYAMAKGNVLPNIITSFGTKRLELIFCNKVSDGDECSYGANSYTTLKILKPFE